MMGVPLMRTKLASYAVGAFAGGLGGVAFATHVNGVYAERFNFTISIFLLAMVVLGGMGNVWGVILGAFILSWVNGNGLTAFGQFYNDRFGTSVDFASFTFLLFGLVLILMMLFKREGLLPESRLKLMLHEDELDDEDASGSKKKVGK
jgi:branched-chain amino acid transport system permease protein